MSLDPRLPVIVGAAQLNGREGDSEPVAMMTDVASAALADSGSSTIAGALESVRVLKGVWPYRDPGALVADRLGLSEVSTVLTSQLSGDGPYDLVNETAHSIQVGELDAALICSAETMRTRRRDKAAGRRSPYIAEADDAAPGAISGSTREMGDAIDHQAGTLDPVNFYALTETAIRHRRGESVEGHRDRIARLWARGSEVAAENPRAWIRDRFTAEQIATPGPANRVVAAPYPKLMTSNIDVDQAAAVVLCNVAVAESCGVPRERWTFLYSGTGANDHWVTRTRWALDESPALRIGGHRALELADLTIDDVALVDLYACFPSAVQVAQHELGMDPARPFTITGGLTFAGGPFGSYGMLGLVRAVTLLRESPADRALLHGNGGYLTKHSFLVASGDPPTGPFRRGRPQSQVDALPARAEPTEVPGVGTIEGYTVAHDRDGSPNRAILSVLDADGGRTWANSTDPDTMLQLLADECVGRRVGVEAGSPPVATLH